MHFGKPWHDFGCGVPTLSTIKLGALQWSTIQFLTFMLEPVCCKKLQKSPIHETGLGNREPLETLNELMHE